MIRSLITLALLLAPLPAAAQEADIAAVRARAPTDELVYFVLPDRFENGDARTTGAGSRATGSQRATTPPPRVSTTAAISPA